jgi:predicted  nucleic acid-binding Zn-ribbon protein
MAEANKKAAPAAAKPAKTRTVLTDAQRIEKLEADLAAAKQKAAAKADKVGAALRDKKAKLETKIADLQSQVREIDVELEKIGDGTTPDPDPITAKIADAESTSAS